MIKSFTFISIYSIKSINVLTLLIILLLIFSILSNKILNLFNDFSLDIVYNIKCNLFTSNDLSLFDIL